MVTRSSKKRDPRARPPGRTSPTLHTSVLAPPGARWPNLASRVGRNVQEPNRAALVGGSRAGEEMGVEYQWR